MIYTRLTMRAMQIAYDAHHGQVDKAGMPYIYHPIHVAEQMDDEYSTCVALLHDTVEDTEWTIEQLQMEFPPEVTDAVALLTHEPGVAYSDYLKPIRDNAIARKVKLADIAHNSDATRMTAASMPREQLDYFRNKYAVARAYLLDE